MLIESEELKAWLEKEKNEYSKAASKSAKSNLVYPEKTLHLMNLGLVVSALHEIAELEQKQALEPTPIPYCRKCVNCGEKA